MCKKNAIKRKSLADINGGKLSEINRLLTEETPQINRYTDKSNFSRIPNRNRYPSPLSWTSWKNSIRCRYLKAHMYHLSKNSHLEEYGVDRMCEVYSPPHEMREGCQPRGRGGVRGHHRGGDGGQEREVLRRRRGQSRRHVDGGCAGDGDAGDVGHPAVLA